MSAAGLDELRSNVLRRGTLEPSTFRAVRWEVGGFRDRQEQSVLEQLREDVIEGRLTASPELQAKVLDYVQRGPDGLRRRLWNATKGAAVGVAALGAVAGAIFLLKPSIVMYLVAQFVVTEGAPIAALGGAAFGSRWDN